MVVRTLGNATLLRVFSLRVGMFALSCRHEFVVTECACYVVSRFNQHVIDTCISAHRCPNSPESTEPPPKVCLYSESATRIVQATRNRYHEICAPTSDFEPATCYVKIAGWIGRLYISTLYTGLQMSEFTLSGRITSYVPKRVNLNPFTVPQHI